MAKINHVNLSVSNMDRSVAFYDALMFALGFEKGLDESGEWGAVRGYRSNNGTDLEIISETGVEYRPFNRYVGLNHIAFEVESKEKVDAMYNLVKDLGVEVTREPQAYPEYSASYYAFYFRDPDGIPLEVAYV